MVATVLGLTLITSLLQRHGLEGMRRRISPTAAYGGLTRGPRLIDGSVRERMAALLAEVTGGARGPIDDPDDVVAIDLQATAERVDPWLARLGVEDPRVGLMSVGEEETKGGPRIRRQYLVLKGAGINFIGNVEGRDVFTGAVDVVVCDGFTGNVVLKVAEGVVDQMGHRIKQATRTSIPPASR